MATTKQKGGRRRIFVCLLILLVLLGGTIVWLIGRSKSNNGRQVVNHLPVGETDIKPHTAKPEIEIKEVTGETADNDELAELENLPLPSPFDEEVHFTPYKPGSLIYHVDHYVKDEVDLAQQISNESFTETLLNMSDWKINYYKLIMNAEPNPAHPACLKFIIYSRRFAKLVEHGYKGFTVKERLSIVRQLKQDLVGWRRLWADGQRIRANVTIFHSVKKRSDELIAPLSIRINATMLLAGAFCIEEALPSVIESVETLGLDTNWSAAGYTCDKILTSLDSRELNAAQQKIIDEYHAWKAIQNGKIFGYETVELPSFRSPRRPFERATSLGASLDFSEGKISIEIPPQYLYLTPSLHQAEGYYDPTGSSEILKRTIDFARAYCEAEP